MPLVSAGSPARIGSVQLDVVTDIRSPRSFDRTTTAVESGAPVTNHRQRVPDTVSLTVIASDVPPFNTVFLPQLWEADHAKKLRDRLFDLQAKGEPVTFFDGERLYTTPSGSRVWLIDNIDEGKSGVEQGTWRATITLGEMPTYATTFSPALADVDASLQDSVDGIVDTGQQSTETVPTDIANTIP